MRAGGGIIIGYRIRWVFEWEVGVCTEPFLPQAPVEWGKRWCPAVHFSFFFFNQRVGCSPPSSLYKQ